ncbi:uncharacterized protein LOC142352790 [Convolutriloba macropyga]
MGVLYVKVCQVYKQYELMMLSASAGAFDIPKPSANQKKSKLVFRTMLASVIIYGVSWTPKELMRLLCFLKIIRQTPDTVRVFVLFQAFTTLHSLCNPVLYACTYSQFRYQFCKQVNMVKAITLSILKCDWFKMKQLCGLNSSKTIAKLIPIENKTHRNGSSNTNTDFGYGSTNNFLSDSFIASNRTWSSTKS